MADRQVQRRLSAILAADVAGYTARMEADTDGTVAAWQDAREDVIKPRVADYSGKIVKLTGDGFLVEFPTVQDAVKCAIAMQEGLADSALDFRMGVNMGDIVDDGEDIHGEGVNVAARLEALAEPGGICISGDVYNQVRNRIDADYHDMGLQDVKNVSAPVQAWHLASAPKQQQADTPNYVDNQVIKFCTAPDGVQIAYSTLGQGPPVIFVANWLTHLELDLQMPSRRAVFEMLARNYTVVRYDARGNGLSDWDVDNISFEASLSDLAAVIDDLGLDNFALIGQSQGAAISAAYAARNPDKVNNLVLYGGYARGRRKRGSDGQIAESDAFITMIREGWGKDIDTYVQMFGTFFMPDANAAQLADFTKFQRAATPPGNAARIQFALDDIDISGELAAITAPSLVLHLREDARAPFEEGRRMAAAIPGARFVPLEGRNHAMLADDPSLQRYLEEIDAFLAE
jgi:class 3 adenylate cyclase/pimeloyl-ACP methyl ester carboxylesterase